MNVLITAASSSLAYKLEQELNYPSNIIFADAVDLPSLILKNRKFIKIPAESSSFAHVVLTACLDLEIRQVFPLRKFEVLLLSEANLLFKEYGITIMTPDQRIVRNYLGELKTGKLIIKGLNLNDSEIENERGAFLFNPDAKPELQLLTVD